MDRPLARFYCDVCGQPIDDVSRAYVIWHAEAPTYEDHSFKIIHQRVCDQGDHGCSGALSDFLGADGLAKLTAMISLGPIKGEKGYSVRDMDEFVDFLRRVQLPYYEEARRYFAEVREDYYDANEVFPYLEEHLKEIIEQGEERAAAR